MAYRYIPVSGHGDARRPYRHLRVGPSVALPPLEPQSRPETTRPFASKPAAQPVDFAIDLDVRQSAKDGRRGSGAC
jgi:hypothetical protein